MAKISSVSIAQQGGRTLSRGFGMSFPRVSRRSKQDTNLGSEKTEPASPVEPLELERPEEGE
jgi:hypothetical protein